MASTWFHIVLEVSALVCGLVSGVFLTFSDFVMRSLDRAGTAAGVEVMQTINREVFRSVFMVLLLGMSALSPVIAGTAYYRLTGPVAGLIVVGGAFYFVGVFLVSLVFNVPMNQRLAAKDAAGPDAAAYWMDVYLPRWSLWNWVRAIAAAASAGCYLVASHWLVAGTTGTG